MSASLALVGLVVGVIVGLTSTGGGALLTPALVLLGVPPAAAVGSDVLIASGMKLFGGSAYALKKDVHWNTVWHLAAGSLPGAVLGIIVLNLLPASAVETVLQRALGGVLVLAGVASLVRVALADRAQPVKAPAFARTAGMGLIVGFLVATTSVGSGSLLLCALVLFFPLRPATMVGTDLVHALLLSSVATVGHLFSGTVDFGVAAAVLVGGIPGVLIGAKFAYALPQKPFRIGLAVLLLFIGGHFFLNGAQDVPETQVIAAVGGVNR